MEKKNYSVFFKDGDATVNFSLSRDKAMKLARKLEKEGHGVIVAKKVNDDWKTVYETE